MYPVFWLAHKTSPGKASALPAPVQRLSAGAAALAGVALPSTPAAAGEAANLGAIIGATQTCPVDLANTWYFALCHRVSY